MKKTKIYINLIFYSQKQENLFNIEKKLKYGGNKKNFLTLKY
jgi:hypothetical protein